MPEEIKQAIKEQKKDIQFLKKLLKEVDRDSQEYQKILDRINLLKLQIVAARRIKWNTTELK